MTDLANGLPRGSLSRDSWATSRAITERIGECCPQHGSCNPDYDVTESEKRTGHTSPPGEADPTPAERLRALEISGDPDASDIAQRYKSSPLDPMTPVMRQVARTSASATRTFRATYARATRADADEAEERYAAVRAKREASNRAREQKLFQFAKTADRREHSMLRLTQASVLAACISLLIAGAALIVAISSIN